MVNLVYICLSILDIRPVEVVGMESNDFQCPNKTFKRKIEGEREREKKNGKKLH